MSKIANDGLTRSGTGWGRQYRRQRVKATVRSIALKSSNGTEVCIVGNGFFMLRLAAVVEISYGNVTRLVAGCRHACRVLSLYSVPGS